MVTGSSSLKVDDNMITIDEVVPDLFQCVEIHQELLKKEEIPLAKVLCFDFCDLGCIFCFVIVDAHLSVSILY